MSQLYCPVISEQTITSKIGQYSTPSRLGAKTSLDPITGLLDRLGHPEQAFRTIHVGGTSGKGSTSTFLANILGDAGYKVGLFTKPHLESVCERFVINGFPIPADEIMAQLEHIGGVMAEKPTWFELTTAVALQYFAEQHVDIGVIEVGLGGRYDATNIIFPELSILTNVGLDHVEILGDTVEKIAEDKVGIIKPGEAVISGVVQPNVIEIVERQCAQVQVDLRLIERDFRCANLSLNSLGGAFDFRMDDQALDGLLISMLGQHQVVNASVAVAAALELNKASFPISLPAIRSGLRHTRIPGRMEIIHNEPTILLDGAHSPPKMEALVDGLCTLYSQKERRIGVLAFSLGHDLQSTLTPLLPLLDTAILTEFHVETDYGNKRAQDPYEVAALIRSLDPEIELLVEPNPNLAVDMALNLAGIDDLICVTGSIFLVGQVRKGVTAQPYGKDLRI